MKKAIKINTINWRVVLIIMLISYLIFKMYFAFHSGDPYVDEDVSIEYITVFSKSTQDKLTNGITYHDNFRNPISVFDYDQKYDLVIHKVNLYDNRYLNQIIKPSTKVSFSIPVYSFVNLDKSKLLYISEKTPLISNIYLNFKGDSLQSIFETDNVLGYNIISKYFSINLNDETSRDIVFESKGGMLSVNILFLKKDQSIFFMLLSPKDKNEKIKENLLYTLIN